MFALQKRANNEGTDSTQEPKKSKTGEMNESNEEIITETSPLKETGSIDITGTCEAKWQLSQKEVLGRLAHLRVSHEFSDCVLLVGSGEVQETFQVHGMVLCMSSPKFEEVLISNKQEGPIEIKNVDPHIFNLMLDYMYMNKLELKSAEEASMVYKAAVAYCMPHLCEISARFMARELSLDNIWPVLQLVAETQEPVLKEECGKFVRKNPLLVLRHSNFVKVDQQVVEYLVDLDCLDVPELELMQAVDRWAEQQCLNGDVPTQQENKRAVIGQGILSKLRFLTVGQTDFVKELAFSENNPSSILTLEESYAILMNLTTLGSYPMPMNFSVNNRPRKLAKMRCVRKGQIHVPTGGTVFSTPPPNLYVSQFGSSMDRLVALGAPSQNVTLGGKNFSLDVKVDHSVVLYGVQVPTIWYPINQGHKPPSKDYDESFIVTVLDPTGTPISNTVLNSTVPYASAIDINLKDPVSLQKNVAYKIQVYTSNMYFLTKKLSCVEDCPPVKFTFKDCAKVGSITPTLFGTQGMKQETDCGFITQLIYSLDN